MSERNEGGAGRQFSLGSFLLAVVVFVGVAAAFSAYVLQDDLFGETPIGVAGPLAPSGEASGPVAAEVETPAAPTASPAAETGLPGLTEAAETAAEEAAAGAESLAEQAGSTAGTALGDAAEAAGAAAQEATEAAETAAQEAAAAAEETATEAAAAAEPTAEEVAAAAEETVTEGSAAAEATAEDATAAIEAAAETATETSAETVDAAAAAAAAEAEAARQAAEEQEIVDAYEAAGAAGEEAAAEAEAAAEQAVEGAENAAAETAAAIAGAAGAAAGGVAALDGASAAPEEAEGVSVETPAAPDGGEATTAATPEGEQVASVEAPDAPEGEETAALEAPAAPAGEQTAAAETPPAPEGGDTTTAEAPAAILPPPPPEEEEEQAAAPEPLQPDLPPDDELFARNGDLVPNSGQGVTDDVIYAEGLRFPFESSPAYANSQVYGVGGFKGPRGGQCDRRNYSYPWRDNFCELRGYAAVLCPTGKGHQGQDIRPATCEKDKHWAVAVESGLISHLGTYTVTLVGHTGREYRYMHLNMRKLEVKKGDRVLRGDRIGYISNDFGGTPTTIHLHFEIRQVMRSGGKVVKRFVPPYSSLKDAYRRLLISEAAAEEAAKRANPG